MFKNRASIIRFFLHIRGFKNYLRNVIRNDKSYAKNFESRQITKNNSTVKHAVKLVNPIVHLVTLFEKQFLSNFHHSLLINLVRYKFFNFKFKLLQLFKLTNNSNYCTS